MNTKSLDVVILAGGLGTRLAGVWDGPKCLVPVAGVPLLERLLRKIDLIQPQNVIMACGHQANEVDGWIIQNSNRLLSRHIELHMVFEKPTGTANALRACLRLPLPQHSLLVLNGDTLPLYDLGLLMYAADALPDASVVAAWHRERYAGAAIFNPTGHELVRNHTGTDLDEVILPQAERLHMARGFIDIGTPEAFHRAQQLTEKNLS